jgi:serine/threonine protein kinase/tetratricopeptide (TPR) repeat protein
MAAAGTGEAEAMKAERWPAVERLYHGALERAAEERAAFLREACGSDEELRREVESLLAYEDKAKDFIENPALLVVGELMADGQSLVAGQALDHYTILELLGAGGMGEVYLAEDTRLNRRVALKLLPAELTKNEDRVRRFEQEARAASALNHPNILTIYEIGQAESIHFITTEYIEGDTLRLRLASAMKLNEVLEICSQVASALAAAHKAGIIHRDIKPENIMIRHDGIVKVLDFGLAKLLAQQSTGTDSQVATRFKTGAGVVMGTASYMSPEQARGLKVDARTDIFSLGVMLYEMVAGRAPFAGETTADIISVLIHKEPPSLSTLAPDLPAELPHIVSKALRKDRDERYQTITDLLVDLKDLKRELDLRAQLERRASPELPVSATTGGSEPAMPETAPAQAAQTGADATARTTSSAEYIVSQIKSHKRSAAITLAALVLAVAVVAYFSYFKHKRAPLTEQDTILIADFDNKTGDEVFNGALKQALAVQLEQSPFLNIFPDERIQQTLRLMGRTSDVRVTRDVAREICERQGLKAMLIGSIAQLGSHYVIALEVVNARTGDVLARDQVEAESKEQVLSVLGKSATQLREKLGESLSTIQKFDALGRSTTSSLEALKAYSGARDLAAKSKTSEAISFMKRAVELDPQFASAYNGLAVNLSNIGEREAARNYAMRAFELRERASEREKLWITAQYYHLVTGELERAIETEELYKQTYPREPYIYNALANSYGFLGQHEKAVEEMQEAVRLDPNNPQFHRNLARQLRYLGRFQEAGAVVERAWEQKIESPLLHLERYVNAFLQGDGGKMQSQMDWLRARPDDLFSFGLQTAVAEVAGQHRKAREFRAQWVELSKRRNYNETAAGNAAGDAQTAALSGHCELVRQEVDRSLVIARSSSALRTVAVALALCGELGQAQSLADEYARLMPTDTLAIGVDLPVIRAAIANHRGNYTQAIELLKTARRYDHAEFFKVPLDLDQFAPYLRGQAFLGQHSGAEAAAEFQYLLDHRSLAPFSLLGPLAQLGLARAAVLTGDNDKAHQAYQDFFAFWKDADPDLPILLAAKKEYAGLK